MKEKYSRGVGLILTVLPPVVIYSLALILAYNGYKEHILSHFVGDYIDTPELSKAMRHAIRETFPWDILVFTAFCLIHAFRRSGQDRRFTTRDYIAVVFFTACILNLVFISKRDTLAVLNMSFAFVFIILLVLRIAEALYPTLEGLKHDVEGSSAYLGSLLAYFGPYTESLLALQERVEGNRWLVFFVGNSALVLVSYLSVAVAAYLPTIDHIFRNDHWLFLTLATSDGVTLQDITRFNVFKVASFAPLRYLVFYAQTALLGTNVVSYHLLSIIVHGINGFLVFLVIKTVLGANLFPFLTGLLFVVLASHFDTVAWSFLFDIQAGSFFYLLALVFLTRYMWLNRSIANVYLGLSLSMVPAFLRECFILGPVFVLSSFFLWNYYSSNNRIPHVLRHVYLLACGTLISYMLFFYLTTISQKSVTTEVMTFSDIFTWQHVCRGTYAAFAAMVDMSFLNNLGIFQPSLEIRNVMFLHAPWSWHSGMGILKFLVFAPLVPALFYCSKRGSARHLTLPILLAAVSSLLLTCIGRIFTGGFDYIVTRPHFVYFPNAMFLIFFGLLIWPPDSKKKRLVIYLGLIMLISLNFKNTYALNGEMGEAMKGMNTHHQRIKSFLAEDPNAALFLNFIPRNSNDHFSLCTDIAFDILFPGRITKSVRKATHIYDSTSFTKNPGYSPDTVGNTLGDFTVEWLSSITPSCLRKEVSSLGSNGVYPKIAITPAGFIEVQVVNPEDGTLYSYGVPYPQRSLFRNDIGQCWDWIVVEKQGKELCFVVNGVLLKKFHLDCDYLGWQKDGKDILGNFYRGIGENALFGRLFVMIGDCKHKSGSLEIGHKFNVETKKTYCQ